MPSGGTILRKLWHIRVSRHISCCWWGTTHWLEIRSFGHVLLIRYERTLQCFPCKLVSLGPVSGWIHQQEKWNPGLVAAAAGGGFRLVQPCTTVLPETLKQDDSLALVSLAICSHATYMLDSFLSDIFNFLGGSHSFPRRIGRTQTAKEGIFIKILTCDIVVIFPYQIQIRVQCDIRWFVTDDGREYSSSMRLPGSKYGKYWANSLLLMHQIDI